MSAGLSDAARRGLASLGIRNPDPDLPLHVDLVDTFDRLGFASQEVLTIAVMWVYKEELDRQVDAYATAKTEYERVRGAGVIRYRLQGERSAEVAGMKAEAEDPGVHLAAVAYRKSEHMIASAKKSLDILHAQLDTWRTQQADARKADEFIARTAT